MTIGSARAPARVFHRGLDGYERTPLLPLEGLAARIGVAELFCKVETQRFGLPSFKILGASWAAHRALERVGSRDGVTLVAATEGNHGRAVARAARWAGVGARIYVPQSVDFERRDALVLEGAEVITVDGTYDDAVDRATSQLRATDVVISDVARDPAEETPRWVIEGYATIADEVTEQLDALGASVPDVAVAQVGVGSFAASVVRGFGRVIGVEAAGHACVSASLRQGTCVTTRQAAPTSMSGLNCATPSAVAWEILRDGLFGAIEVGDDAALEATARLGEYGIATTPTGAAGLAGLVAAIGCGWVDHDATALIFITEGRHP